MPVPAGTHHVRWQSSHDGSYGSAELTCVVRPGEHVPVFYRRPTTVLGRAAIGHLPQAPVRGLDWGEVALRVGGPILVFVVLGVVALVVGAF